MANQKITELESLSATQASNDDITVVVDIDDLISPTGNTKNMKLGELANFVIEGKNLISSSGQIDLNQGKGPLSASLGGTGISTPPSGCILYGKDDKEMAFVQGTNGEVLSIRNNVPTFITGVISGSEQVDFTKIQNVPYIVSSAAQLDVISSSAQVSFIGLNDTPSSYTANSLVVSNTSGSALIFISASNPNLPVNEVVFGGKSFCNGTYYFNGDIRERIYANPNYRSLYTGSFSPYFEDFIHSGNIYLDRVNLNVYFCRGTWPRRKGLSSSDLNGFTWRESNNTGTSTAEAICRTRDDGEDFEVLINLYREDINGSGVNSVKNSTGSFVVSEPSAVVYDIETDKIFFACRNDHNNSIVYRMDASGTSAQRAASVEVWVEMNSGDLNIDSLDIATTPKDFYASNNPLSNERHLYIGVSPDYNSNTNTSSTKHAAIFKVPTTGTAPGQFNVDYPVAYTIHRFWAASFNSTAPRMDRTGVKGIKVFFAKIGGGEWNPSVNDYTEVRKDKSRLYVISSGASSLAEILNSNSITGSLLKTVRTETLASDLPAESQSISDPSVGVGPGCTEVGSTSFKISPSQQTFVFNHSVSVGPASDGYPQVPVLQHGDNYPNPCYPSASTQLGSIIPAPAEDSSDTSLGLLDNENFGGHALLELLIGDVAGTELNTNFQANDDANRLFKTWRAGYFEANGSITTLNLEFDDPAQPIGTPGSGIGAARGIPFQENDRLFILTSPVLNTEFDGQTSKGTSGCHGVVRIQSTDCANNVGRYELEGGNGVDAIGTQVMVIPILANTLDQDVDAMIVGSQGGLQQFVIDPINEKFYIADFGYSKAWNEFISKVEVTGTRRTLTIEEGPWESQLGGSTVQWTATSNTSSPYTAGNSISGISTLYPSLSDGYIIYPGNWNFSWPQSIDTSRTQTTLTGNHPAVPGYPGDDAYTDATFRTKFSSFGAIFEGDLFIYSRGTNGSRIFDNQDPEIAYSRPCGITGYNIGPNKEFRLIYTNGENNFELLENSLGLGKSINGLSRTFVKDGVLAHGKNVLSVTDAGSGPNGGVLVTMTKPSLISDYALVYNASNGSSLGTGQQHDNNPTSSFSGIIDLADAQDDASLYFPKNRSKFRLTYNDGELPDVIHFACFED